MTKENLKDLDQRVAAWVESVEGQRALKECMEKVNRVRNQLREDCTPRREELIRRMTI